MDNLEIVKAIEIVIDLLEKRVDKNVQDYCYFKTMYEKGFVDFSILQHFRDDTVDCHTAERQLVMIMSHYTDNTKEE